MALRLTAAKLSSTKPGPEKSGRRVETTVIGEEGGSIKRLVVASVVVLLAAPFVNFSFFFDETAQTRERLENCQTFVGKYSEEAARACLEAYDKQEGKIALFRPTPKFGYWFSYIVFALAVINAGLLITKQRLS